MAKSIKRELGKYLNNLDESGLRNELIKLFDRFSNVREYYSGDLTGNQDELLEKYKAKIEREYFPSRGFGKARISECKKVIHDFKEVCIYKSDLIELILFNVRTMLDYAISFGDINTKFYNSLITSYHAACKLIVEEQVEDGFWQVCEKMVEDSIEIGWGVWDELNDIYINSVEPEDRHAT